MKDSKPAKQGNLTKIIQMTGNDSLTEEGLRKIREDIEQLTLNDESIREIESEIKTNFSVNRDNLHRMKDPVINEKFLKEIKNQRENLNEKTYAQTIRGKRDEESSEFGMRI